MDKETLRKILNKVGEMVLGAMEGKLASEMVLRGDDITLSEEGVGQKPGDISIFVVKEPYASTVRDALNKRLDRGPKTDYPA